MALATLEHVRARPSRGAIGALLCFAGLLVTGVLAYHWPLVRSGDASSRAAFRSLANHRELTGLASTLANSVAPTSYAVIAIAFSAIALLRRRLVSAIVVPVTMVAASVTTELLKPLVGDVRTSDWFGPHHQVGAASWPSGHATAAMMVALGGVIVAPAVLRPLVALLGSALAIGVSYSILMLGWHFPSDVLGGFLVAGMWTSLAVATLSLRAHRSIVRGRVLAREGVHALFAPLALATVAAGGVFGLLVVRGRVAAVYASSHVSLVFGATAIAVLAALMSASLTAALGTVSSVSRGGGPAPRAVPRHHSQLGRG